MARCRWNGSAADFAQVTSPATIGHLVDRLAPAPKSAAARSLSRGESGSWAQSLPRMAAVLQRAGLPEVRVLLEYNPYQAGHARADVILAGVGSCGHDTYVVCELKQWSSCH